MRASTLFAAALLLGIVGCEEDPTEPVDEILGCEDIQEIQVGQTVSDALTAADCTSGGFPADYHRFDTEGATLEIQLVPDQANPFRPLLVLLDDEDQEVERQLASSTMPVGFTVDLEAGTYAIAVTTTSSFGAYQLSLAEAEQTDEQ